MQRLVKALLLALQAALSHSSSWRMWWAAAGRRKLHCCWWGWLLEGGACSHHLGCEMLWPSTVRSILEVAIWSRCGDEEAERWEAGVDVAEEEE